MSEITVISNYHLRDVIDAWQLTPAERADFDYLDWPAIDEGRDSASFVRYRGELYDIGEFMTTSGLGAPEPFRGWDGYMSDSYFSGLLIRYPRETWLIPGREVIDPEHVVIARYYS